MNQFQELAKAMREGAKLAPQAYGVYQSHQGNLCALGAVARLVGISTAYEQAVRPRLAEQFPVLETEVARSNPHCSDVEECCDCDIELFGYITHLNDFHLLTREQIADWLDTLEGGE